VVVAQDPIQTAVDQLAERLQRSVVINDAGVHLLYASAHYGDEDPVRIRAVLQREADGRAIGHVLAQGVATWTTAGIIPPNPELAMKARVCLPIRWRGDLLGLLMVMDGDGSLTTGDLVVITATARDVAPLLGPRTQDGPGADDRTVLDLVGADSLLRRRALAELATGAAAEGFPVVTVVELGVPGTISGPVAAHAEAALRTALSLRPPAAAGGLMHAVTGGVAVVVLGSAKPLGGDDLRGYAGQLLHRIRDLSAGRFDCLAGIGADVPGLERAYTSAAQARLARRAGPVLGTEVATWAELGPYGVLLRIPPADLDETALPAELQRLLSADPQGQLTRTVRAYLDHAGNGPAAAEALHIHRTTLYYRLGRVRELTGLDLDNGRTRLTLHLGLTLADVLAAHRRGGNPGPL
jgi:hypothetical protein